MFVRTRALGQLLCDAERQIALLGHCEPLNFASEYERLRALVEAKKPASPEFRYGPAQDCSALCRALAALADLADRALRVGSPSAGWLALFGERARELDLEARLVEARDTPSFRHLAEKRFRCRALETEVLARVEGWQTVAASTDTEPRIASHDPRDSRSLLRQVERALAEYAVDFRVELSSTLVPHAATGADVIWVRAGRKLREIDARRIALHEVLAHAAPRARARQEPSRLFLAGTAGGAEDEEGRAIVLEQRHGSLDGSRRQELWSRYVAAGLVFDGVPFVEVVRHLREQGVPLPLAVLVTCRAHRGGGLGRERVYLDAWFRVARAIEKEPSLERWLERGRIGVARIPELRALTGMLAPGESVSLPEMIEIENALNPKTRLPPDNDPTAFPFFVPPCP